MKKLSLKNLNLEANDMLQQNELKTVFGGYGSAWCSCSNGSSRSMPNCSWCGAYCGSQSWICSGG